MPSRTNTSTATAAPGGKKFELPALEFKFASLTDGTDIPPPLPSPIQEEPEPLKAKPAAKDADEDKENKGLSNGTNGNHATSTESQPDRSKTGVKRPAEDSPMSPTLSSRQGSIRRLFSRNLLNTAYTNGDAEAQGTLSMDAAGSARPTSRSNGSIGDGRKAKRSSGWFRRLRGGDDGSKRASTMFEEVKKQPAGPPPPMIPELAALEAKLDLEEKGSLGSDLFKDIK